MTQDLKACLRDMLGPDVGIGISDPRAPTAPLWEAEKPAMARAIPKRVAEFTAGRQAARIAMADLGLPATAIPMGEDRAPIWPDRLVGSISHCDEICLAVVSADLSGLGVDIEPDQPLEKDLWDSICTPDEVLWLQTQQDAGRAARRIFCAKEAFYKAQYPLSHRVLTFQEVGIEPFSKTEFTARMGSLRATGHFAFLAGLCLSTLSLPSHAAVDFRG